MRLKREIVVGEGRALKSMTCGLAALAERSASALIRACRRVPIPELPLLVTEKVVAPAVDARRRARTRTWRVERVPALKAGRDGRLTGLLGTGK
jgi:hypothetical protein